jgi:hypothetical protein
VTVIDAPRAVSSDIVTAVRQATDQAAQRGRRGHFSFTAASAAERVVAPILGLYLGYSVVRLPEVFPQLAVPHLPMILILVFAAMLAVAIPTDAWSGIWKRARSLRLVAAILGLAVVTMPLGIWPTGSFTFLQDKYLSSVIVFVCCLVFLRDRRAFRVAVATYVLCVGAVSVDVLHTYDPNAVVLNDDGDPIAPQVLEEHPDLRRLRAVGQSLDPNDFGAILCATFPLALWLSVGNARRRVFWTGMAVLFVAAVVPTQSRGSELGFVATSVVLVGAGARGWRRWLSIGMIAGCVGLFVMMATGIGAAGRFTDFSENDYNIAGNNGRWWFWKQGVIWSLKRPWGYGIGNFATYFGMLNREERAAHSSWIQYLMELGFLGLYLFASLCRYLVNGLRRLRRAALAHAAYDRVSKDEEVLAGHMLAVLTAILVTGSLLSSGYNPLTYMSLGLAGAVLLGTPVTMDQAAGALAPAPSPRGGAVRRRVRVFPGPQRAR